jgi:tRNA(Arg) A34 adenosine deaminase TadA
MLRAFTEAEKAAERGEVPVGAVISDKLGNILAAFGNQTLGDHDPTAHAEMLVIREVAAKLGSERLIDCDMYVTLEPCAMCAAAISFARIRRLYYAATDEKMGAIENGPVFFAQATCHHKPDVYGGIGGQRAEILLRDFFKTRR